MKTYRFDGKHIKALKNDTEAFNESLSFHDDRSAHIERLDGNAWLCWDSTLEDWVNPANVGKSIEYCFPTSPMAEFLGFGEEGCYVAEVTYYTIGGAIKFHALQNMGFRLRSSAGKLASRYDFAWKYESETGVDFFEQESRDVKHCIELSKAGNKTPWKQVNGCVSFAGTIA